MTNPLAALVVSTMIAVSAAAAGADDKRPAPATGPAAATPATQPAHYVQAPGSSLVFTFEQAGAASKGSFKQFATTLDYDEKDLAASRLDVKVQIASLDTQDKDRDSTLVSADLFDAQKFPTASYAASSFAKGAGGRLEAVGKLTIRGVTKDLRLPLAIRTTAAGLELSGEAKIKRLDFGVGQGEWASTEWVGDVVTLTYKVALAKK